MKLGPNVDLGLKALYYQMEVLKVDLKEEMNKYISQYSMSEASRNGDEINVILQKIAQIQKDLEELNGLTKNIEQNLSANQDNELNR